MAYEDWEVRVSKIQCPMYAGDDCPYCDRAGYCHLLNPAEDCDDYAALADDGIDRSHDWSVDDLPF